MLNNILNLFFYTENGMFSETNKWINLHLLVSKLIVVVLCGAIATEMQVQIVTALAGDSTLIKVSNLISLLVGFVTTAFLTKKKNIEMVRKYYLTISIISISLIVMSNLFVVLEDSLIFRFFVNTIIESSMMNLLANSVNDTINHRFSGTERTIYSSKVQLLGTLAALLGVCLAFFIKMDLNSLLIMEAIIYIVSLAEDMFVFSKLQKQVFGEAEDSPNTIKEAA